MKDYIWRTKDLIQPGNFMFVSWEVRTFYHRWSLNQSASLASMFFYRNIQSEGSAVGMCMVHGFNKKETPAS